MKTNHLVILTMALIVLWIPSKGVHASAVQPVADIALLIQNIEHTLKTIHIEHQTLVMIAQKAKQIGQSAQMIINMQNQLMLAKRNLETLRIMIKTGQYKSISELNALCYKIQGIGWTVENIGTTFDAMFQDKYLSKALRVAGIEKQEQEIKQAAKGAMATEAEAIKGNIVNAVNIKTLMDKSQEVAGVKGAVQVNNALLAELASQNMEIKKLLAMISRMKALETAKNVEDEQRLREENKRFMSGAGEEKEGKGIMTETLEMFIKAFSFGYTAMVPEALKILQYFIVLEIFFFGVLIMFTRVSVSHEAVKKFLVIGFYVWLIPNIGMVSEHIKMTFAQAGLFAGGEVITLKDMFDPSAISTKGYDIALPLFGLAGATFGLVSKFLAALTALVVFVCFLYISWVLFMTSIEFAIITVSAVYLMPFSLFKPLQFIAERTITAAVSIGIRFMIIGVTFCGAKLIIDNMVMEFKATLEEAKASKSFLDAVVSGAYDLTYHQLFDIIVVALTIALIFFSASKISTVYFGGASVLSDTLASWTKSAAKSVTDKASRNKDQDGFVKKLRKATSYA